MYFSLRFLHFLLSFSPFYELLLSFRGKKSVGRRFSERIYILVISHLMCWMGRNRRVLSDVLMFMKNHDKMQCCGSVSFWYGSGSWPNLDKNSKFRNFLAFFLKKNFVDLLCLLKNALNTQILEHFRRNLAFSP